MKFKGPKKIPYYDKSSPNRSTYLKQSAGRGRFTFVSDLWSMARYMNRSPQMTALLIKAQMRILDRLIEATPRSKNDPGKDGHIKDRFYTELATGAVRKDRRVALIRNHDPRFVFVNRRFQLTDQALGRSITSRRK